MLANNILTINHLLKILGSFCAEDLRHLTVYQPLSDQHNYASPTDLHRTSHRPAPFTPTDLHQDIGRLSVEPSI